MVNDPLVSVVMSVRNDASRVVVAAKSILDQSYTDLELIVIDDGSTDTTGATLGDLASKDPRVRVIRTEGLGLTKALITGCELARGVYIVRQDSDDWSHPLRIAEQVAVLQADASIGFVSCATEFIGPRDEFLSVMSRPSNPDAATQGLLNERLGPPAHGSVMFRRSLYEQVGGYRPQFFYSQDSDLWLRMAEQSKIAYIESVRYHHRKDPGSISAAKRAVQAEFSRLAHACRTARCDSESETEWLAIADALRLRLVDGRAPPVVSDRTGTSDIAYLIGSQLALNGDKRAGFYLVPVIMHRPWHWRAILRLIQSFFRRRVNGPRA